MCELHSPFHACHVVLSFLAVINRTSKFICFSQRVTTLLQRKTIIEGIALPERSVKSALLKECSLLALPFLSVIPAISNIYCKYTPIYFTIPNRS